MGPPQSSSRGGPMQDPEKKGSVRRAREMLEAGTHQTPPETRQQPRRSAHHSQWPQAQSQWPLPPAGIQPDGFNARNDLRFLAPSGPPPKRPPRPSEVPLAIPRASQIPSPSVYSERSGNGNTPEPNPQLQNTGRHRTFSLPGAPMRPSSRPTSRPLTSDGSISPTSTADMSATPRISVATENTSRHSFSSASSMAVPFISAPRPAQRRPADRSTANLAPPNARLSNPRRCSVSPIPEEHSSASERGNTQDYGSTGVFPASWGSGPAESEILGAYLDDDSDTDGASIHDHPADDEPGLVRSASLGKRQKPTMRTITKSPANSDPSLVQQPAPSVPPLNTQGRSNGAAAAAGVTAASLAVQNTNPTQPSPLSRVSTSSQSGESYVDPAKPRIAKPSEEENRNAWEKEMGVLPMAAPTMSDKRPGGRKPPRLDMGAVRDAEKRGSLSSMTDLIRRATRLASNLEHGRTASKAQAPQATPGADFRDLGPQGRRSGSLSGILASFPNPSVITPEVRGSWPVFFGRANTRGEPLGSYDDTSPEKEKPAKRKCCGMPRRWFIVLCIVLFIIVVLAVLLPVFLVAVPRENANSSYCASSKPCKNGGVSVSSGSECSCVCAGGYTGSQCTHSGDSSCVTSSIDSGSVHNNATMGSSIPSILDQSQERFNIELDPVTIMALFSMGNITCRTENALVSFNDVNIDESSKRRSVDFDLEDDTPTSVVVVARAEETTNGIVYEGGHHGSAQNGPGGSNDGDSGKDTSTTDNSDATTSKDSTATKATDEASHATATKTGTHTSSAPTATSTSTKKGIPLNVVEFSRAAVLMILQHTGSFSSAQYSETEIQMYLTDSYASAAHPSLDVLGLYAMDFEKLSITAK